MSKYEENLERIKKAIAFEPVDRVPVAPCANAYYAKACGLPLKTYITDFDAACTVNSEMSSGHGCRRYPKRDLFPVPSARPSGCPRLPPPETNWETMTCGRSLNRLTL